MHKYGPAIHYLDCFHIDLKDEGKVKGPGAISISTGKTIVVNEFETDPIFALWKDLATEYGLRSCTCIPMKFENGQAGLFVVYSDKEHVFTTEDVQLFERIRDDVVFSTWLHQSCPVKSG